MLNPTLKLNVQRQKLLAQFFGSEKKGIYPPWVLGEAQCGANDLVLLPHRPKQRGDSVSSDRAQSSNN